MPSLESFGPLKLSGILRHHRREFDASDMVRVIGRQWADYLARRAPPPEGAPDWRYGVALRMADGDHHIGYFCGALSADATASPRDFHHIDIPLLNCAVFEFSGHVLDFREYIHITFGRDLPECGLRPAPEAPGVPEFVERYDWRFNITAGRGNFDVLIPVAD